MRELEVSKRIKSFDEVALGYDEESAVAEAERCIQCKNPKCVEGCPVGINIPTFIKCIKDGGYEKAIRTIKLANNLPAVCGRVCPQEDQCEGKCVLGIKGDPINIGGLERFAADFELSKGVEIPEKAADTGRSVAVVGSGPAGLTAAGELARMGHEVVVFEALHKPGGVLSYGIPEFRLPKRIVSAEIECIEKLGVRIETNVVIGKTLTIEDLFEDGFDSIFIGTGAGLPAFLNVPGENLCGIYSANEYLIRINLMESYKFPHESDTPVKVNSGNVVVGGGNVAIDSARCALRLSQGDVTVLYRRTETEMPARRDEIRRAKEEGVKFRFLTQPVGFIGDGEGRVKGVECVQMCLGSPDESGRRRPIAVENSNFLVDADVVVVAIGQNPNPLIPKTSKRIKVDDKHGTIIVDPYTLETSMERVFAGGDIVTGAATVISAMEAGKKAANSINKLLSKK
ncbi:MAG: NADPH-dependent glutamate synthase [Candidatus Bathyarchaeia archaeon]